MTFRNLARVGATGLLAAGSLAFAAVPAFAADVDFGLDVRGTTIAADATGKLGFITVTNDGTTKPSDVDVLFDVKNLVQSKVQLDLGGCTKNGDVVDCAMFPEEIPGPGLSAKLPIPLVRQAGASGPAGQLTITVKVAGDTNDKNDSKTVDVTVGDHGVDLTVIAPDVTLPPKDENSLQGEPIPPGGSSVFYAIVANQGDMVSDGMKVALSLPKDVTISEDIEGCTISADRHSAECDYSDFSLVPLDADTSDDKDMSTGVFTAPVTVSKDAKGPASLKGGMVGVMSTGQSALPEGGNKALSRRVAPVLPKNFRHLTADEVKAVEVDATDNTDTFAVLVAGPQGGSGGGEGNGGGGEGGGLPVTGPVAASVAGVGGAVIVAGAVLFFVARRRRVVVVTPSEDK